MPTVDSLPSAATPSSGDRYPVSQTNEDGSVTLRKVTLAEMGSQLSQLPAIYYLNGQIIDRALEIPAGSNGLLIGPVTVAPGANLSIPNGSFLKVL